MLSTSRSGLVELVQSGQVALAALGGLFALVGEQRLEGRDELQVRGGRDVAGSAVLGR